MNGHTTLPDYQELLAGFRKSDAERDDLLAAIVKNYEDLKLKYEEKCDDYNNEVESRRMWQGKAKLSEVALSDERQASGSSPFALAIIDGDGAIFQDVLYASGKDGGADAAHQLQVEIRNQLKLMYPEGGVGDWNIVVQVILNLQGLGTKLQQCGIILNPNELAAFGRQFGLTQPLFSFVDVGGGKERADHKIRETLRLFLPITQCKHIFFGPCHDNGYLPVLEPYKRDPTISTRLTLIETRVAEPGFESLGFRRARFPRIFRSEDLPPNPAYTQPRANGTHYTVSERPVVKQSPASYVTQTSSRDPSADSHAGASTWATLSKAGSGNVDITTKKAAARKFILLNAYDERVDQDLPKTDASAEHRFADRVKLKGKLCNNFHLGNKCASGDYCDYYHGERLSPGEQLVLKHKARSLHCPSKFGCREFKCFLGHNCKFGTTCALDYCRFADTHNSELDPAKKFFEDQSEEWLASYLNTLRE